jgi:hypothetical protein
VSESVDYTHKHLSQLIGLTVKHVAKDGDPADYETYYSLVLEDEAGKETVAFIQADEECNGPGWLGIEKEKV